MKGLIVVHLLCDGDRLNFDYFGPKRLMKDIAYTTDMCYWVRKYTGLGYHYISSDDGGHILEGNYLLARELERQMKGKTWDIVCENMLTVGDVRKWIHEVKRMYLARRVAEA